MLKITLFSLVLTLVAATPALAQSTFEITPNSSYQATGTATITVENNRYRVSGQVTNLPQNIPSGGSYYILWATITDGRADNIGTITNGAEVSALIVGQPTQVFVTAEKERFPEFVQGPRLAQTKEFSSAELTPLPSPSILPIGGPDTIVGQPNDAPETGLGGSYLFYTLTAGMIVFGTFGFLRSLQPKA